MRTSCPVCRRWLAAGVFGAAAMAAGARGQAGPLSPEEITGRLIAKTNEARQQVGLPALQADPRLGQAAREHSVDMMRQGRTTHESTLPGRRTPEERFQAAFGTAPAKIGESVARVTLAFSDDSAALTAHIQTNLTPEGFAMLAEPDLSMIGAGCVVAPDGAVWVTILFAKPAGRPPDKPRPVAAKPAPRPAPRTEPPGPDREPPAPPASAERVEELLVKAINEERGWGIGAQGVDARLRQAARGHSAEMARQGRLTHDSEIPGRGTATERYEWEFGAPPEALYETVAAAPAGPEEQVVKTIMTALRGGCGEKRDNYRLKTEQLPEPYRHLLSNGLRFVGVGCAVGPDGRFWVTALYAGDPKRMLDYEGEFNGDHAKLVDAALAMESRIRADAERMGQPLTKYVVEWRNTPVRRGDPLTIELHLNRVEKRTWEPAWGGRFAIDIEVGDLNTRQGQFLRVSMSFTAKIGALEPDGRLHGVFSIKSSVFGSGVYQETPEMVGTWEGVPTDQSRREYALFVGTDKGRFPAGTLRRKGSHPATVAALPAPVAVEAPRAELPPAVEPPPDEPSVEPPPIVATEPERPDTSADEARAEDIRWLRQIDDALATAERRKIEAREKLVAMTLIIRKLEERAALLQGWLDKTPPADSANYLEELFAWAREAWDTATMGPPPEPSQEIRGCLQGQIARLRRQVSEVRQEQDELIQQTIETYYDAIAQELELRGPRAAGDDVRASAGRAVKEVAAIKGLATADLYLAAGQDAKFREAARACIAEGRFAADARYLEAVYFLGKRDLRQALAGFRRVMALTAPAGGAEAPVTTRAEAEALAGQGDSLWQRARQMSWMLEDGYLKAIDAKASAEALRVQGEVADRLQKGGDEGMLGCMLGYLKVGVFSATSAIMHRDDAVVNLAAKYENEVAAQHCGLLLMQSLHERGFPLAAIGELSNEQFLAAMRDYYGEAGAKLEAADGVRLRAAVKAALRNPDVNRLVSGSKQELRVDAGRDYFGHDALAETSLESWGDVVNMANVATLLMPMSTYRISGKLAGVRYTGVAGGAQEAGAAVQTAREGFAAATGLNKLPALLAETRAGRMMIDQAGQFLARSSWTENRALEMTTFLVAGATGEATGGTIGVLTGSDGRTEAEAGRMLAELLTMWTVGDPEAMKEALEAHGLQAGQVAPVVREAERVARTSAEVAALTERDAAAIRECLPSEPGAGITAGGRQAAARSKEEIGRELDQIRREIGEGRATPDTLRRIDALELDFKALSTAERGAEAEAREWLQFMERRAKEAGGRTEQARAVASEAGAAQSRLARPNAKTGLAAEASAPIETEAPPLPADLRAIRMPSLRTGHPMTRTLDEMWIAGRHEEALAGYRKWHAVVQHLRLGDSPQVKLAELPQKVGALRRVTEQRAELGQLARAEGIPDHRVAVTPAEVARLDADPNIVKTPIVADPAHKSYSDPYWVWELRSDRAVKVGVFKGSGADFRSGPLQGLDLEGEELYANLGRKLGLNVPACTRGTMTIDGVAREGVFVRMAGGVDLERLGPLAPALFTQQIAEDRVVATLLLEHDRKMGNLLAQNAKELASLDHGMADARGLAERDWALGRLQKAEQERVRLARQEAMAEGRSLDGIEERQIRMADVTPDQVTDEDVESVMRRAVEHWRNRANIKPEGLYRLVDEQITIEKMSAKIRQVEELFARHPEEARTILRQTYHTETEVEAAMRVLTRRARLLDKVLRESFGTIKDLKPIPMKTAAVEQCGPDPRFVIPPAATSLAQAA